MDEIKLTCNKCEKGNLKVLDLVNDDYLMSCNNCPHMFSVHYTGFDAMMDEAEYFSQINDDVRMLSANGTWVYSGNHKALSFGFENFTKDMKLVHKIESYETTYFFQKGANFYMIDFNAIHQTYKLCTYRANEDALQVLMKHFFKSVA